jgi:cell division GTPase FtsZ
MKLAMIGFGQAGGKIVDRFLEHDKKARTEVVKEAIAVNTARTDLQGLAYIPETNRILIGQSEVKGHGVGAKPELGAEIAEEDIDEIQAALEDIRVDEIDAFLVVAGLGGGTGSGGSPVLARHLKSLYEEPVYGLGILPAKDEGRIYTLNAARSFKTFVDEVDNMLIFDNENHRRSGESVDAGYERMNDELVRRFSVLFSAGEVTPGVEVAESVVDSSEIINTLAGGGVSTVGYATQEIEQEQKGLLSRFRNDDDEEIDTANRITSLVRMATKARLTLECNIGETERALVLVSGPPKYLSRKGIERGRRWLEEQTGSMEVRGGDYPVKERNLAAVVLLSGVTDVPRIRELQEIAVDAQEKIQQSEAESAEKKEKLVHGDDDEDEVEPLF